MENEIKNLEKKDESKLKRLKLSYNKLREEVKKAVTHLWEGVGDKYRKVVSRLKRK